MRDLAPSLLVGFLETHYPLSCIGLSKVFYVHLYDRPNV